MHLLLIANHLLWYFIIVLGLLLILPINYLILILYKLLENRTIPITRDTLEIKPHITFQMLSFSFFIYAFQLSNSTERKFIRKLKFKNEVKK